jgi:hypothetical protein
MKPKIIKVRPKLAYKLLGTSIELNPDKVYDAVEARHIPGWKERELLWVNEVLLERNEYVVVK